MHIRLIKEGQMVIKVLAFFALTMAMWVIGYVIGRSEGGDI